jgi:hypothetical protein
VAPARTFVERGIPVALATDFNPGTSPTPSLPLVMTVACLALRLTPSEALARAMSDAGFAASLRTVPVGEQLCQQHCPVAHVAHEFPQLCEAETEAISRVLGTHVQRLATIAHGDGVCTTCIPEKKEKVTR